MKLDKESQLFYDRIRTDYGIADEAGLKILLVACQSLTTLRKYESQVERQGLTVNDRFGIPKPHALLPFIRDTRAAFLAALKQLNLEFEHETPARIGRPPSFLS